MTKYEVLEQIGNGGMATVHRARLRGVAGFERIVALKRIRPELATEPDYVRRFISEARIASALSHPNIVQVLELGRDAESHFMAMEYLEGWPVLRIASAASFAKITIPLNVIVSLLHDLCDALDHVHARGIIHRDVSHGNLWVLRTGHLKLIDFGIATIGDTPADEIVGKPSYMAPEAIRGEPCDGRTDLFAVGVVAWELLTQQKLFTGVGDRDTMQAVLRQRVLSTLHYRRDCPLLLDVVVRDLLAKDVRKRTASAAVLREQLEMVSAVLELDVRPAAVAQWVASLFVEDQPTRMFGGATVRCLGAAA